MQPYEKCQVHSGHRIVIEAAAGTGKTYNIARIVARIIMERPDVTIDKMVIVTFTRAAAAELKTRISQLLTQLERAIANETYAQEELIQKILKEHPESQHAEVLANIRKRLRIALLNLDTAAIGTIHSFASRCLTENGFDSNLKFGFSLSESTDSIINDFLNDYARSLSYDEENNHLSDFIEPETFKEFAKTLLANPDLDVNWPENSAEAESLAELYGKVKENQKKLAAISAKYKEQLEELTQAAKEAAENFRANEQIKSEANKRKKDENATAEEKAEAERVRQIALAKKTELELLKDGAEFALEALKDKIEKKKKPFAKALEDSINGVCKFVSCEALQYAGKKFAAYCAENNIISQDGLILNLRDALKTYPQLCKALQEKFTVGLIDEFQDTNDAQFDIFRSIFLDNPQSTFIVVGDPRQAIYAFRNCDIQTYLNAKNEILANDYESFEMSQNRRSGQKFIDSLNGIFARQGAFAMENMDMPEQKAVSGSKILLTASGEEVSEPPITMGLHPRMNCEAIYKQCAEDICALLQKGYFLPPDKEGQAPKPLEPGDIAVLTFRSWEAIEEVRKELQALGIPARLVKYRNVFSTAEAGELLLFLEGILNFSDNNALLRALTTSLSDLELNDLKDEKKLAIYSRHFEELNDLWQKRSFMIMYNELVIRFNLNDRIGAQEDGARIMSNFNTMADYLGEEAYARKLTPGALVRTLQKWIAKAPSDKRIFPARPETDRGAVVINTIFGSKGLSYPVVFMPDLFHVGKQFDEDKVSRTYHRDNKLCYNPIGLAHKIAAQDEAFQENLRQAYVGFTRAKYYCRFYYGNGKSKCSPVDWLFKEHGITQYTGLKDKMMKQSKTPFSWGTLPEEPCPAPLQIPVLPPLRRPDLLPFLACNRGFLSFSSITPHGATHANDAFGDDKNDEGESDEEAGSGKREDLPVMLQIPSGTNFGNVVHAVMEECDFKSTSEELEQLTREEMRYAHISADNWANITAKMLYNVLNAPIPGCGGGSFKLSEIDPARKKCEFEFLYEFGSSFKTRELFTFAKEYFEQKFNLVCSDFEDESSYYEKGFFNGSIDLFFEDQGKFYIVDWKTNKLDYMSAYKKERLPHAMAGSRYYLQYMIYTAALFKYLKHRLGFSGDEKSFYEQYVGGVRYIFVRGTYEEGNGVFSDRMSYEEFKKLEEIIG